METTKNKNMYYLWWVNQNTQKKFCAGRAFYCEQTGDYALFINLLEASSNDGRRDELYLKPIQASDGSIYFRLEKVIRRDAKKHRFCIGEAFQSEKTNGDIHVHIEPLTSYSKKLVLVLGVNKGAENE